MTRRIEPLKSAVVSGLSLANVLGIISPKIKTITVVTNVVIAGKLSGSASLSILAIIKVAIEDAPIFTILFPIKIAVSALL